MTGICRPVSKEDVRSPSAAVRPLSRQGGGSGSIGRGLNSMSAARLPLKSATMKIRCLRASLLEPAQYWASMSRQHTSGVPPRTIPAFPHLPEGGIGTSVTISAIMESEPAIAAMVRAISPIKPSLLKATPPKLPERSYILEVVKYIDAHYSSDLTIESLLANIPLSRRNFEVNGFQEKAC